MYQTKFLVQFLVYVHVTVQACTRISVYLSPTPSSSFKPPCGHERLHHKRCSTFTLPLQHQPLPVKGCLLPPSSFLRVDCCLFLHSLASLPRPSGCIHDVSLPAPSNLLSRLDAGDHGELGSGAGETNVDGSGEGYEEESARRCCRCQQLIEDRERGVPMASSSLHYNIYRVKMDYVSDF